MFVALAVAGVILLVLAFLLLKESLPAQLRRSGGLGAATRSYGSLLRDPTFMGLALLSGFLMAAVFTYVSSATFVFQEGFGLSAQQFALIFGAGGLAFTAGTQLNGAMLGRIAPEQILRFATLAALAVTGAMVVVSVLELGIWPLIVLLVSSQMMTGILLPAVALLALEPNAHRAGSAAALLGAMQFGFGAAIAPITGLFDEGSAIAMTAVMFAATAVIVAIMLIIRPAMRRRSAQVRLLASSDKLADQETRVDPMSAAEIKEANVVAGRDAAGGSSRPGPVVRSAGGEVNIRSPRGELCCANKPGTSG
jgi:DHA1 family bicyclomycin/chloramphenicol resistance-like MFS transporter